MCANRVIPARASASQTGRPLGFGDIVPGKDRHTYKHKIYWRSVSNRSADAFNSIVTTHDKPCLRRWLEFIGGKVPITLNYTTLYDPVHVSPRPMRYWTLYKSGEQWACYTNCVEAWLVCLAGNAFAFKDKWYLVYTDRTVS
jgi:hypothetical protein